MRDAQEFGVRSSEFGNTTEKFHFEDLAVYKKALDYIDFVYELSARFPSFERFALSNQFQRAAASIALNLAEGSGGTKLEFQQFIKIARRSVRESVVCTTIAVRRRYITSDQNNESRILCIELSKMLSGLLNSVK